MNATRTSTPRKRVEKSASAVALTEPASLRADNTSNAPVTCDRNWPVVPLGEVVDINPRLAVEPASDSLASFIPMKSVEAESGRFAPLGDRTVSDVRKGYTPFQDGDVLFAKVTPCMENGKAAVMAALTNGIGSSDSVDRGTTSHCRGS